MSRGIVNNNKGRNLPINFFGEPAEAGCHHITVDGAFEGEAVKVVVPSVEKAGNTETTAPGRGDLSRFAFRLPCTGNSRLKVEA